jgi:hypothetical protein
MGRSRPLVPQRVACSHLVPSILGTCEQLALVATDQMIQGHATVTLTLLVLVVTTSCN